MTELERIIKLLKTHGYSCEHGAYNDIATILRELDRLTCRK